MARQRRAEDDHDAMLAGDLKATRQTPFRWGEIDPTRFTIV